MIWCITAASSQSALSFGDGLVLLATQAKINYERVRSRTGKQVCGTAGRCGSSGKASLMDMGKPVANNVYNSESRNEAIKVGVNCCCIAVLL